MFATLLCYEKSRSSSAIFNHEKTAQVADIAIITCVAIIALGFFLTAQGQFPFRWKVFLEFTGALALADLAFAHLFQARKKSAPVEYEESPRSSLGQHNENFGSPFAEQHTETQALCVEEFPSDFAIQQQKTSSREERVNFPMMTFNGGMLPGAINFFQRLGSKFTANATLDKPKKRACLLEKKFEELKFPIICGQEVFSDGATKELLKLDEYNIVHHVGDSSLINSGLFFASLFPIQEVKFWKFTNLASEDALSAKGVLRVAVEISIEDVKSTTIFYVTHLQSKPEYKQCRLEQLIDIRNLIQEDQKTHPHSPIFLLGDLNVTDIETDGSKQNEYTEFTSAFFSCFVDTYLSDHNAECMRTQGIGPANEPTGSFYDMVKVNGEVKNRTRYDYCLLYRAENKSYDGLFFENQFSRMMEDPHVNPPLLSDHLPLMTWVDWKKMFGIYSS